jgi:hypothetical protein
VNLSEPALVMSEHALRAALAGIERPLLHERSAKAGAAGLRAGRCLVSFPRGALGPGPRRRLQAICAGLGAPEAGFAALDRHQSRASAVHFGYDPEPGATVLKCYLEFAPEDRPEPGMVFLALKWRSDGTHALSRYWTRDGIGVAAQKSIVNEVLPPGPLRKTMLTLMRLSPEAEALRLLEVEEEGSSRRSVDLNLSGWHQKVGDRKALLSTLLGATAEVRSYLDDMAGDSLGHVAVGIASDGLPFATLYHGAHRVFGDL